jgi:uncharacterized oligopeptide transporter (OPT) family protein
MTISGLDLHEIKYLYIFIYIFIIIIIIVLDYIKWKYFLFFKSKKQFMLKEKASFVSLQLK